MKTETNEKQQQQQQQWLKTVTTVVATVEMKDTWTCMETQANLLLNHKNHARLPGYPLYVRNVNAIVS